MTLWWLPFLISIVNNPNAKDGAIHHVSGES